jgi:hypothetical protein
MSLLEIGLNHILIREQVNVLKVGLIAVLVVLALQRVKVISTQHADLPTLSANQLKVRYKRRQSIREFSGSN